MDSDQSHGLSRYTDVYARVSILNGRGKVSMILLIGDSKEIEVNTITKEKQREYKYIRAHVRGYGSCDFFKMLEMFSESFTESVFHSDHRIFTLVNETTTQ